MGLSILGYALLGNQRVENLFGVDVERLFESYVTDAFDGGGPVSIEALVGAVETSGWERTGRRGSVEKEKYTRRMRHFSKEGREIVLEIRTYETAEAASSFMESVEQPAEYVQFGPRVVTVEPASGAGPGEVASVLEHLRTYRDMLRQGNSSS